MLRFSLPDARLWRYLIEAVSALVDEVSLRASPEGLKIRAMDPSHVALVDLELEPEAFTEYECDEPANIGLSLPEMLKLMKNVKAGESMTVILEEGKRLRIEFVGAYKRTVRFPSLELSVEEIPSLKVDFTVKAKVVSRSFRSTISEAQTIAETVKLKATREKLSISARGEISALDIEYTVGSEALLELEVKEEAEASYNLEFLSEIVGSAYRASDILDLEFASNMPLKLTFNLINGRIEYYLAPYIE